MKYRALRITLVLMLAGITFLLGATVVINRNSDGRLYSNAQQIPHREVGLILGCSKLLPGGYYNPFFEYRIQAAVELYRAGKVDYLLVSGDHHIRTYDEAKDMKASLIELGVPANRIYSDYAGFRTLDSVVRSRAVFGQSRITIISQEFHNRRAIFIARHHGIDAIGFNAHDVGVYYSPTTHLREQLAKMNTVLDIYLFRRRPKFYGPKILIDGSPQPAAI